MESNNRFCTYCGKPVSSDARFCGSCGASIQPLPGNGGRAEQGNSREGNAPSTAASGTGAVLKIGEEVAEKIQNALTVVHLFLVIAALIACFIPFCSAKAYTFGASASRVSASAFQIMTGEARFLTNSMVGLIVLPVLPLAALFCSFIKKKQYACWTAFIAGIGEIAADIGLKNAVAENLNRYDFYKGVSVAAGYSVFQTVGWVLIVLGIVGAILFVAGSDDSKDAVKKVFIGLGIVVGFAAVIDLLMGLVVLALTFFGRM